MKKGIKLKKINTCGTNDLYSEEGSNVFQDENGDFKAMLQSLHLVDKVLKGRGNVRT